MYRDSSGEWRWQRFAPNNEKIGASTEGYTTFENMVDNAERINGPETTELKYVKVDDE
jgi:uncharacterized protein YegP (UPF0339 family)